MGPHELGPRSQHGYVALEEFALAIPEEPRKIHDLFREARLWIGAMRVDLCVSGDPARSLLFNCDIHSGRNKLQKQNLAFSNDSGRTWKNYAGNPVADLSQPDFRDPKVFWYEPQRKWVMVAVLADERKAVFLDSRDLKTWTLRGSFAPASGEKGQWECPDLFELAVNGSQGEKKWVLIVNRNPGAPAGGTGVEYFVGAFDGARFVNETPATHQLWADYGKDFYATNSFSDIPPKDGRRIWIGWMSNWQYANREPTMVWRGAQSLPRALKLKRFPDGIRLVQSPIDETKVLRKQELLQASMLSVPKAMQAMQTAQVKGETLEIEAELAPEGARRSGFRLRKGGSEETILGVTPETKRSIRDRTHSGQVFFCARISRSIQSALQQSTRVKLHIFLDRSSVETSSTMAKWS